MKNSIRGKLIGGLFGLTMGDLSGLPLGALLGFILGSVLGHFLFDEPQETAAERVHKAYQRRQGEFLFHVFSLCAKVAKSDGPVNRAEVAFMERLMRQQFRLNDGGRAHAIRVWNEARDSQQSFDQYARAFFQGFGREQIRLRDMLDLLFAVAAADGGLHPREEELLLRAAGIFRIGRMQYERIKSRFYEPPPNRQQRWSPLDPYYALLGAEPHESLEIIKKKFRALALKWHPDKVTARGASHEAVRHAKEKFQQINEAYEKILEARKV